MYDDRQMLCNLSRNKCKDKTVFFICFGNLYATLYFFISSIILMKVNDLRGITTAKNSNTKSRIN